MKRLATLFLTLICMTGFVPASGASEIGGVTLPDQLTIGGTGCRLAGSGLRTKFFFKIYAAGLYLESPVSALEQAVNSDQPKAILMHFIYNGVSAEKLREAWMEGFDGNTPSPAPDLKERLERFTDLFTSAANKDDLILLSYRPNLGTTISFNGREAATIPGSDFNQALLRIWFGVQPADQDLKQKIARDLQAIRN